MTPVEAVATPESSATPLETDLGEMFGDFTGGESPEPEDSAEGSTPSEPAEGAVVESGDVTADGTESAEPTSVAQPEDDPFKDTTAGTYMVNGQPVTIEDIRVFKEGGAVIRPESLPNLYSKLAERDTLAERIRARDTEYQTLSKVSEWTDSQSGKTFTGPEAAIENRIANAGLFAENKLIVDTITDPERLSRCLTTELVADGKGGQIERVVFSPQALDELRRENTLQRRESDAAIRDHYKAVIAESSKAQPASVNFERAAPALITAIATGANLDPSVLTAADRALLTKHLPAHVRDGNASLDWQELVKDRIQLRTDQKASSQKLVSTTADATKKGLANMAAAARGMKPKATPTAPAKAPTPQTERAQNEGDLFDSILSSGAAAMRSAR